MKLSLLVLSEGTLRGRIIPIPGPQLLIGRDAQCHLRPASPSISKRHCLLLVKGSAAFVRDLDSTNGTFLNDEPVQGERQLRDQDTLTLGPLSFQVRLETSPSVAGPTPPPRPSEGPLDDDSAAALLLAFQDDGGVHPPEHTRLDREGLPATPAAQEGIPAGAQDDTKVVENKPAPTKPDGDTSQAAAAILEKYLRRKRQ
jgi:pSer/pThr/pTyr-binding forkhead associated (FHA) protein